MEIPIDTLELARELRDGGVDEKPAETIARAIQRSAAATRFADAELREKAADIRETLAEIKAVLPTLASKADLAELRAGQKFLWWGVLIALVVALIGIVLSG